MIQLRKRCTYEKVQHGGSAGDSGGGVRKKSYTGKKENEQILKSKGRNASD